MENTNILNRKYNFDQPYRGILEINELRSDLEDMWVLEGDSFIEEFPKSNCTYNFKLKILLAPVWLLEEKKITNYTKINYNTYPEKWREYRRKQKNITSFSECFNYDDHYITEQVATEYCYACCYEPCICPD